MYALQNDTELKFNRVLYIQLVIFLWTGWTYKRPIGLTAKRELLTIYAGPESKTGVWVG